MYIHWLLNIANAKLKDGFAPLGMAAQQGHLQTVQSLLQAGANINHQAKVNSNQGNNNHIHCYPSLQNGSTALLVSSVKGHSNVVKLLLQAGAKDLANKVLHVLPESDM